MDTPEILTKAAEVIDERGWFQGASQDPLGTDRTDADYDADIATETFDDRWLIPRYGDIDVVDWNDAQERTAEQVTTALRECAAELSKAGA